MTKGEAINIVRDLLIAREESSIPSSVIPNPVEWEAIAKLAGVTL